MNTDLMLRIADEIEARPEIFNQQRGALLDVGEKETCPLCVAGNALRMTGNALRMTGCNIAGVDWYGLDGVSARAETLLELITDQAYWLFAAVPHTSGLAGAFNVSPSDLNRIKELQRWRSNGLHPAAPHTDNGVSFDTFWRRSDTATPAKEWRRSAARVMAATLRLIAAGHAGGERSAR